MPRKIRELEADLVRAGFRLLPKRGKGSHRRYAHPDAPGVPVTIAGARGDDAQAYLERDVRVAIARVRAMQEERRRQP